MSRGDFPCLTAAQRAEIGRVISRRAAIRAEIKRLRAEFQTLPTNGDLIAKFGVTASTLYNVAKNRYLHAHPLDAAAGSSNDSRETPNHSGA